MKDAWKTENEDLERKHVINLGLFCGCRLRRTASGPFPLTSQSRTRCGEEWARLDSVHTEHLQSLPCYLHTGFHMAF